MKYYVSAAAVRSGDGSEKRPFRTISEAAAIAVAGDQVLVGPGVYREYVDPKNAGREDARIEYVSTEMKGAVITGAEVIKGWEPFAENVWKVEIPNGLFGNYNPYTTVVKGDWYWATEPVHTGEVYLNGKAMYETMTLEGVVKPEIYKPSWDQEFTLHKWYTEQADGCTVIYANFQGADPNAETVEINVRRNCFYPSKEGVGYITLSGFVVKQAATQWAPPTAYQEGMIGPHWSKGWIIEDCEVSDSRCSGISLGKYLQPNNENKWSVLAYKDGTQTERDAICQAQREGWTKENIGSHIIRRCEIHDCGQTGIVGHLGGVFSLIEDNHIHHINNKQDLAGAEIGGIKMHAAIDVIYRRNHIHHCTRGLWLDWQAQGTRVTQNVFHHNVPAKGIEIDNGLALGEDIFVEVSHGPTLIDNNLLLSEVAIRLSTQGLAMVHNIIAGSFDYVGKGTDNQAPLLKDARFTPYHVPHRTEVAGFMTILHGDDRFYNNIFIQQPVREDLEELSHVIELFEEDGLVQFECGTSPFSGYPTVEEYIARFECHLPMDNEDKERYYDHLPVWTGGNVFFNGAKPCDKEKNYHVDTEHEITWELTEDGKFRTNLYQYLPEMNNEVISTELLGMAFEPEEYFENPDGTPIVFQRDYFDAHREPAPLSGPFAQAAEEYQVF
ncbi:MAG: right-handed parallel beta-helix repeat-containing protein [Lachnospiraceae bacterium]|nr:right-handed parallel beta-helix repeat-containing protein [Lachnospiraceae bacterium]